MKDYEGLTEVSIELDDGGETVSGYYTNAIPRTGEFIEIKSTIYKVLTVTHCIDVLPDKQDDVFVRVLVYMVDY